MKPATPEPELVITRIFDAPRELVFKAWTDPRHITNWWGPHGFTTPYCTVDLRPGGAFRYCMHAPDGTDIWVKGIYHEILAPEKIVSTLHFSDKDGNFVEPMHYNMGTNVPHYMTDTLTFEVHAGNKTKFTVHRNTPLAVSKTYGEEEGWNQSFDRLVEELARMSK